MRFVCLLLSLSFAAAPASAREKKWKLSGRLQTSFEAREWFEREWEPGSERDSGWISRFAIERARLEARFTPTDWARLVLELEGAAELAFPDRYATDALEPRRTEHEQMAFSLRDAYAQFTPHPLLMFRAGQFKKPFSRLRLTSPWDLLLPRRGLLDARAVDGTRHGGFGGRDAGLMVYGKAEPILGLRYWIGAFSGPMQSEGIEQSSKDFVGRLEVKPFSWLSLAVDACHKLYHYREGPVLSGLALARGNLYTANLFGADAMLEIGPFSLSLEGALGANVDFGPGHRLLGAHAIAAYRVELPGELLLTPAFMVEVFDPSDQPGHDAVLRLAGGLNLDPAAWLRFQLYAEWTSGQMWTYDAQAKAGFGGYVFGPVPTRVMIQMNVSL
ncbi:MAG: hypothetical protein GYA21_20065 [Myxococcales bacterium]|nr:hypothetical protein [Myxococcales bacterium]